MSNGAASCYLPNGQSYSSQSVQFTPCDTSGTHSVCCAQGDSCLTSGLCYSGTGVLYRGGCTDQAWQDSRCPQQCRSPATSPFIFMTPCNQNHNSPGGWIWACGDPSNSSSPCGVATNSFYAFIPGGIVDANIGSTAAQAATTCPSPSTQVLTVTTTANGGGVGGGGTVTVTAAGDTAAACTNQAATTAGDTTVAGTAQVTATLVATRGSRATKKNVRAVTALGVTSAGLLFGRMLAD